MGPPHEGSIRRPIAPWANALPQSYVLLPLRIEYADRPHLVDPLNHFLFQPVLHNWCTLRRGMCYPVCVGWWLSMLLIGKSSPGCVFSGFPLFVSLWSLPYVRRYITVNKNELSVSIYKIFHSLLPSVEYANVTCLILVSKNLRKMQCICANVWWFFG